MAEAADPLTHPQARSLEPMRSDSRRNKDRVVEAAIRLLSEDPNASVEAVAEEAGVTRSTVYRRFSGREQLLDAVLRRIVAENDAIFRETVAREPDFERCMDALIRSFVHLAYGHRRLWTLFTTSYEGLSMDEFDVRDEFIEWIERGQREGAIRRDLPMGWIRSIWAQSIAAGLSAAVRYGVEVDEAARLAAEAAANVLRVR